MAAAFTRVDELLGRRGVRRRTVTVVCGAASLLLGACGGVSPQSFGTTPSPSQSGGPGQPSQTLPADNVVKASEADNGRTVVIHVGDRLSVALHSTYWSFGGTSYSAVLSFEGPAVVAASPSGCVPGGGCGSITATFSALSPGVAGISAHRESCGEALLCNGSAGSYRLTVTVKPR